MIVGMTIIDPHHPTRRQTWAAFRGRTLVIELGPHTIKIREKGRRYAYEVSYEQIFRLGAENAARQRREEKVTARKMKRGRSAR
jgi:hypothetical protein